MKIYLAGAMECYGETDKAKIWRDTIKEYFWRYFDDVDIVSPVDYYNYTNNDSRNDTEIFRFDLRKVEQSDLVLVNLNNVRQSIGTCIEIFDAYKRNIPVVGFLEECIPLESLPEYIHPWINCCCDRVEAGKDAMTKAMRYVGEFYVDRE